MILSLHIFIYFTLIKYQNTKTGYKGIKFQNDVDFRGVNGTFLQKFKISPVKPPFLVTIRKKFKNIFKIPFLTA